MRSLPPVLQSTSFVGSAMGIKTESKTVRDVFVRKWNVALEWKLGIVAGRGADGSDAPPPELCANHPAHCEVETRGKDSTVPHIISSGANTGTNMVAPVEVDIAWLLKQKGAGSFCVDRAHPDCRTPVFNPDVMAAGEAMSRLRQWAGVGLSLIHI